MKTSESKLSKAVAALAACLCVLGVEAVRADEEPELVTDRPDQTESAVTVPPGYVQIEAGWLREEADGGGKETTTSVPGTLFRIGLSERVELRLGWAGEVETELEGLELSSFRIDGSGDGELGFKFHLWNAHGARPLAALLVGTSVPIGSKAITSDAWDPAFRFAFEHELSSRVGLAYNLGYSWETKGVDENGDGGREGAVIWTAAMGFALTDRLGAFVEFFGSFPDGDSDSSFDGGFTFLVRHNLQLDLYAGVGLTSSAPDFLGFGFSWRLPN